MSTFSSDVFTGKTALVTGGTSGIGAGVAEVLARHGATVHAAGLEAEKVGFADGLSIHPHEVDVTSDEDLNALVGELDRLDILVPAAGITLGDEELQWEPFNKVISVQLQAVYRSIALSHSLLAVSHGSIVTIASMYSFFGGGKRVAYSAAKGGVVQLTKSLAEAYAEDSIRVNAIAPGWIDTPLLAPLKADDGLRERILSRTPSRRFGTPEEIGNAVVFLASGAASFITGAVLPVDGGYLVTGI